MDSTQHLLHLIDCLAEIQHRRPSAIARRVGGASTTYRRLLDGRPITTKTLDQMMAGLREQWPADIPMPKQGDAT